MEGSLHSILLHTFSVEETKVIITEELMQPVESVQLLFAIFTFTTGGVS